MSSVEQNLDRPDNPDALDAAYAATSDLSLDGRLELFRFKTGRSWVYFNEGYGHDPDVAVKVEPDSDGSLHQKRTKSVMQTHELRELGAPVQNDLILPKAIGQYVVSITEFLSGSYENTNNFRGIGVAIANFHATPISSILDHLPPFDSLSVPKDTFAKLQQLREEDNLPRLGDIVFGEQLVDRLGVTLQDSEEAAEELEEISRQKGESLSLLHNDITPFNAMIDRNRKTVLIDLDRFMTGPAAYDLARPVDHWPRFRRDPKKTNSFLKGYATAAIRKIDNRQIRLGVEAAKARYVATLMMRVVSMALHGTPQNKYLLEESINRISGNYYWNSEETYIRAQTTLSS